MRGPLFSGQEPGKDVAIILEEEYFSECLDFAQKNNHLSPEQLEEIREKYLIPIYRKYQEVIKVVEMEIEKTEEEGSSLSSGMVIEVLNGILKKTRKIGTFHFQEIIKLIFEYYHTKCGKEIYCQHAALSLAHFIAGLLEQSALEDELLNLK